jgi:hypothetical protein
MSGSFDAPENLTRRSFVLPSLQVKLRGILAHLELLKEEYWGASPAGAQRATTVSSLQSQAQDGSKSIPPSPSEAAGIGRSWVQSMFSRDRAHLAGRARGPPVVGKLFTPCYS